MNELVILAKSLGIFTGLGIYLAVFIGAFVYGGMYLDEAFELGHTCTLIGILLGVPLSIYSVYRQLKK